MSKIMSNFYLPKGQKEVIITLVSGFVWSLMTGYYSLVIGHRYNQ